MTDSGQGYVHPDNTNTSDSYSERIEPEVIMSHNIERTLASVQLKHKKMQVAVAYTPTQIIIYDTTLINNNDELKKMYLSALQVLMSLKIFKIDKNAKPVVHSPHSIALYLKNKLEKTRCKVQTKHHCFR